MADANELLLVRIAKRLHELFDGKIDMSDLAGRPADLQEDHFLTRSLTALYLIDALDISPDDAAACITDGEKDGGVDAIFADDKRQLVVLVQSKWRKNTNKGIALDEFLKFREGVSDVISLNWTSNNKNLHRCQAKVQKALEDIETKVELAIVHTSEQVIAKNIFEKIDEFLKQQNKMLDFMSFDECGLARVANTARSRTRPTNINVSVLLRQWGQILTPYQAVYGIVSASDIAKWHDDHRTNLFAENLRYFIGETDVNEGIFQTIKKEPKDFWYFNNGITAICDSVKKTPLGGNNTDSGVFEVERINVINGAQTIGAISRAKQAGIPMDDVFVHLRVIALANTPEGFAAGITRANNTQNPLNPVDFVALDPNQERIRREAEQIGIVYSFRRGEPPPDRKKGFDVRSATIAAACASGDLRLAVAAKRYISGLWEDITKEPYTSLFNEATTGRYLWHLVQIMNAVDDCLEAEAASRVGKDRLIAIHGNRFILHVVFAGINLDSLGKVGTRIGPIRTTCVKVAKEALDQVIAKFGGLFPESYPGNVFKNQERQEDLLLELKQS